MDEAYVSVALGAHEVKHVQRLSNIVVARVRCSQITKVLVRHLLTIDPSRGSSDIHLEDDVVFIMPANFSSDNLRISQTSTRISLEITTQPYCRICAIAQFPNHAIA